MADKQFARSGPAEFDTLADDDPLSELARIVGYDARPAVQQLQELQRHQEAMRREPAFDLEEELLRAFDSYDAPRAEPVRPDSGLVEHPSADAAAGASYEGSAEQVGGVTVADVAPAVEEGAATPELPSGGIYAPAEEPSGTVVAFAPTSESVSSDEDSVAVDEAAAGDPAVDLERELELSLGYDLSLNAANAPQPNSPSDASDPVFQDWQEPLASKLTAAGRLAEQAGIAEPVYVDLGAALAGADRAAEFEEVAVAPATEPLQPPATASVDRLLADVERFPVPAAAGLAAAAVAVQPEVQTRPAAAVKKNNYPFTPTFSRATPVASPTGVSQPRAFVTPAVESAAARAAAVTPVVLPEAAPEVRTAAAPQAIQDRVQEAEVEPSFDIEDFELELADIALDLDLANDDPVDASAKIAETQPVVSHPALVEAPAQPFLQALNTPREAEPASDEPRASVPSESEELPVENSLPFDPSMIGDTESGVAPIAELDVPQLPVVEADEKPATFPADYDLDIDAEMAQLFSASTSVAKSAADREAAPASAAKAGPALASIDDFDEFEKAMEEDFQRSMVERRSPAQEAERVAVMPQAHAAAYREEGYGRRSQRTMLLAASVAGVIILGGAGVYAWMGGSNAVLSGDGPKIILADKEPVKVVPEEKGGKTVPNQDKAVYDRVAGDKVNAPVQQALVSSTEEPMDVVQRTLTPETLPLEGSEDGDELASVPPAEEDEVARLLPDGEAGNAAAEDERAPAVAPRKVRTMIVKPDGTLVPREEPAAPSESAATAAAAAPIPARASAEAVASGSEGRATAADAGSDLRAAAQPATAPDQVALAAANNPPADEVAPVRSVKTTALPQARPAAQPEAAAPNAPAESQAAAETASAQQTAPLATASVPAGSYVIQIASLPSEGEAQKSYNNLSAKFASVIGGRGVDIRKAEIAGKGTYYRVRIPAGSREEANALCSRYKSAGGSCLVTK